MALLNREALDDRYLWGFSLEGSAAPAKIYKAVQVLLI